MGKETDREKINKKRERTARERQQFVHWKTEVERDGRADRRWEVK